MFTPEVFFYFLRLRMLYLHTNPEVRLILATIVLYQIFTFLGNVLKTGSTINYILSSITFTYLILRNFDSHENYWLQMLSRELWNLFTINLTLGIQLYHFYYISVRLLMELIIPLFFIKWTYMVFKAFSITVSVLSLWKTPLCFHWWQ